MQQGTLPWYKSVVDQITQSQQMDLLGNQEDIYQLLLNMRDELGFEDEAARKYAMKVSAFTHKWASFMAGRTGDEDFEDLYWDFLLLEAPWLFESYLYYIERNRAPEKKFYKPRERTLRIVTQDLQDLEDRVIEFYGLSLPPRVGKSTVCLFFMTWVMGKRPNSHNAMSGHSGILADGFYSEAKNIINTQEYTWAEIFPGVKFDKVSAEKKEITLGDPDRFATLTCRGIDGTWTGAVDISRDGYLYVDDLVRDRMESLSPSRLESRYQDYLNVLVDRKNDGSRELMVGTRWNVLDPLGRVEQTFRHDPRYRFRKIPALNENNESNFDYAFNKGFSTQYFLDLRAKLDKPEWMAKYQQSPFIREGLLFPEDELRYFDGAIYSDEYRVVAACDPAFGGGDSVSMPICVDDGGYVKQIIDWVFTKDSIGKSIPACIDAIIRHGVSELRIEKNNGGELYAQKIQEGLANRKYNHCKVVCRPAPTKMSKEAKITAYSDFVKDHFAFLLPNMPGETDIDTEQRIYKRTTEYDAAIGELSMFTAEGKNPHDDAPDGITQLAMIFEDKLVQRETRVVNSPF